MSDETSYRAAEQFCIAHQIRPGYRMHDKREGPSVFSRIGGTGYLICHPEGEPDMQSSWALKPEDFARLYLNQNT